MRRFCKNRLALRPGFSLRLNAPVLSAKKSQGDDAPEFPSLMSDQGPFHPVAGGVTAPAGFVAGAVYCGIKPGNLKKPDLALVCSETVAVGAAVFTTNKIKAAPVKVSMAHLRTADLRVVVLNSGNANACTGYLGIDHAKRMTCATGWALGLRERQVLVCSTGRIGVPLPIERIEEGIAKAALASQPARGQGGRARHHDLGHFSQGVRRRRSRCRTTAASAWAAWRRARA